MKLSVQFSCILWAIWKTWKSLNFILAGSKDKDLALPLKSNFRNILPLNSTVCSVGMVFIVL